MLETRSRTFSLYKRVQGCFWPESKPILSPRTYPVLASMALTLTHTVTKMAGTPVDTEGQCVRDCLVRPPGWLPSPASLPHLRLPSCPWWLPLTRHLHSGCPVTWPPLSPLPSFNSMAFTRARDTHQAL